MFKKLETINFEELKDIEFQSPKRKEDFHSYLEIMEKILNYYLELEKYEKILSENDEVKLKRDIKLFSTILNNVGNEGWKDPNNSKFKKEKFNHLYIEWLSDRKGVYEHFSILINKKEEDFTIKITGLEEKQTKQILEKDDEIAQINGEKGTLTERIEKQKETIKKQDISIKELKADIADKELNKLAESFGTEENKYTSGKKKEIYFGFALLSIPTCIIIGILYYDINNYILSIPFGILTIIFWYFQYFQLKNYYINRDLETNFANRKAVANSFKGLLEMLNEEENFGDNPDLKTKFFEKVSSILYAEVDNSYIKKHNDNVPISKLLDTVNELIKKVQ
ncbi:hypothetical protein A9Q91_00725 [Candidatus Gracilibacteria bacterium 28_42_T64]|nr:hypothetical protein A9Q91_00725 [Candidatus Gracilibacteria bacterium 28_42_T64]